MISSSDLAQAVVLVSGYWVGIAYYIWCRDILLSMQRVGGLLDVLAA